MSRLLAALKNLQERGEFPLHSESRADDAPDSIAADNSDPVDGDSVAAERESLPDVPLDEQTFAEDVQQADSIVLETIDTHPILSVGLISGNSISPDDVSYAVPGVESAPTETPNDTLHTALVDALLKERLSAAVERMEPPPSELSGEVPPVAQDEVSAEAQIDDPARDDHETDVVAPEVQAAYLPDPVAETRSADASFCMHPASEDETANGSDAFVSQGMCAAECETPVTPPPSDSPDLDSIVAAVRREWEAPERQADPCERDMHAASDERPATASPPTRPDLDGTYVNQGGLDNSPFDVSDLADHGAPSDDSQTLEEMFVPAKVALASNEVEADDPERMPETGTDQISENEAPADSAASGQPHAVQRRPVDVAAIAHLFDDPQAAEYRTIAEGLWADCQKLGLKTVVLIGVADESQLAETTASLAIALTETEEARILLVDGDVRDRRLTVALEQTATPGLAGVFDREPVPCPPAVPTKTPRLDFMPAGEPRCSIRREDAATLAAALRELNRHYELILIDGGSLPALATELLANVCDATYPVAHLGSTEIDKARKVLRNIQTAGGRVSGCIAMHAPRR